MPEIFWGSLLNYFVSVIIVVYTHMSTEQKRTLKDHECPEYLHQKKIQGNYV